MLKQTESTEGELGLPLSRQHYSESIESRSERARRAVQARWAGTTKSERRQALETACAAAEGKRTGRPRSVVRCHCGAVTWERAQRRNFDCCRREKRKFEQAGFKIPWRFGA